ncbi:MAG: ABC transporter ATP-binding protein/permease [Firmicutes bacterium]|nr:ABC transporter ATP-binding protein/permease [Bacillota bacterium]
MLEITNINKSYKTGDFVQDALKGVSLKFRKHEFVSVLGPSGSGKTTLLNIIGGLDRYTSGDLIINNTSTKKFKDSDWDAYRNNSVGFIFQSYNLIGHISVLANVEMALTLSGVSSQKRRKMAKEALEKVGLLDHIHKKPNQLSGGQMQRVAIARALVNDPDIILADEPTGALDSKTSIQIMDLIKEISHDKLVIMVTHNPDLARDYASRIIELKDGELVSDSNPITESDKVKGVYKLKKTAMTYLTALKLSFNNIKTKKGRTILTAFASSIGIIGIALVLSLSNGFNIQIEKFQTDALSSMPILITEQSMNLDEETLRKMESTVTGKEYESYPNINYIYPEEIITETVTHTNKITSEFMEYIEKINPNSVSGVSYTRATALNLLVKSNDKYMPFSQNFFTVMPKTLDKNQNGVLEDNYDILAGNMPKRKEDIVLIVDSKNRVNGELLLALGYDITKETIDFNDLLGKELKLILNDQFYQKIKNIYTYNLDFKTLYNSDTAITLKVSGILRGKEDKKLVSATSGLAHTEELVEYIVEENSKSQIVSDQKNADYNVLSGQMFDLETDAGIKEKENMLSYLGGDSVPVMISIYPRNFDMKDEIIEYLDKYNKNKDDLDKIVYTDMADLISTLSGSIMDAITIVLIAFSAISLVVSVIMIGIITYISVLERTKEIGVLRALGARKKDITRVFNAETFIIGITSGLIGIIIARLLVIPTNIIIENLTELPNVAKLNPVHALILIIISVSLTIIGGAIPAKMASKKDPVIALRTE